MAADPPNKLRVMVDANVLVAGSLWPRFPYEVLQHAIAGDYQLTLSAQIIREARTTVVELMPAEQWRLEEMLSMTEYEEAPMPTDEEIPANMHLVRDPKDIHVALAAITAQVDYLITQDKDFTARDESTTELHRRLNIMLPGTFLREHMGWSSEKLEAIRTRTWRDLEK